MSVQLLDKTRKINKLLHNNNSHKVVFNDICKVLSEILLSNILVISKKGKVLGVSIWPGVDEIEELIDDKVGGFVDKMLNERLLSVLSTKENVNLATWALPKRMCGSIRPSSRRLILPESVWEHCSSINVISSTILTTLSSVNTERRWSDWR